MRYKILLALVVMTACVPDDEMETPTPVESPESCDAEIVPVEVLLNYARPKS